MNTKIFISGDIVILSEKKKIVDNNLKKKISDSDIAICNFEAPIKSKGKPARKAGPHLYQNINSLENIKDAGFSICTLANNHIFDYGKKGLEATLKKCQQLNIETIGAGLSFENANKLLIKTINNSSFGFLAFSEAEFGVFTDYSDYGAVTYINHYKTNKLIIDSKKQVNYLIVIIHAGVEGIDLPLPEWRYRYKEICDLGADAVVAHHPHVPQGWENYKGKPIFYSLGNFFFDRENKDEDSSFSVILNFNNNKFIDYEIITHKKINGIIHLIDEQGFNTKLKNLCQKLNNSYTHEIDKLILNLYEKRYKFHIQKAANGISSDMSFFKKMKRIIHQFVYKKKNQTQNNLLQLHNIRIESHRFVIQRALHLLFEKDKNKAL